MREGLRETITEIKNYNGLNRLDEAATKQSIVLRILSSLGWDSYNTNEVYPEYPVDKDRKVDYALRYGNSNECFLEVKKVSEDLEKHESQLLEYSFRKGIEIAVLTNGITWWFYLPLKRADWRERRFCVINIRKESIEEVERKFTSFLSKEAIVSGEALKLAEQTYEIQKNRTKLETTLPKAWQEIVTHPDDVLIELVAEKTEEICGQRPDKSMIEEFITKKQHEIIQIDQKHQPKKEQKIPIIKHDANDCANKKIKSFTFLDKTYIASKWQEMLLGISKLMFDMNPNKLEILLNMQSNRGNKYFSKNPKDLHTPKEIGNYGIFVESNLSAMQICKRSKEIISIMGYQEDDLSVEVIDR